jgi:anti-sigma factor RsiW
MTELSDELLMAYIDGQLDKPQASVVNQLLRRDEALARRVRRLQESQEKFLGLFGTLVRESAAAAPRAAQRPSSGARGGDTGLTDRAGLVTTGIAALLVIFGASVGFTTAYFSGMAREGAADEMAMPPANWSEDIAEFHAYFTPETLAAGRDSQTNPETVRFQLGKLASQPAPLPDFAQHGLRFVRAQTLNYRGNKLMQLVYTGRSDPFVAVYIAGGNDDSPVLPGRFGDVKTVSWGQDGLRFLIAADMTEEALRALAAVARAQRDKN